MTIAESTTIQAYQLRKGGTPARMAILRMIAADSIRNANPRTRLASGDWRAARAYTLGGYAAAYATLSAGINGCRPVWYSQDGEQFRGEQFADAVSGAHIEHRGWFTDDEDCSETARGIVSRLTHGRFIAGYFLSMNDERVYFSEVFTEDVDAARMADEHARVIGEQESEHAARFNAAQELESKIEDSLQRLRECLALRHRECMGYTREEITELCATLREARETLASDYVGVL